MPSSFSDWLADRRTAAIIIDDTRWARAWRTRHGDDADNARALSIPFKFLDFETGIDEDYKPQYNTYDVMGRHAPYLAYTGGSSRTFKFSALMVDDVSPGYALSNSRVLQGLALPWRDDGDTTVRRPPEVLLSIFPESFILLRGVVKSVNKISMTPLIQQSEINQITDPRAGFEGSPVRLISGQVSLDVEFIATDTAENMAFAQYLEKGFNQTSSQQDVMFNE